MTASDLEARRAALIARDGPWTGSAIALPDGLVTREGVTPGDEKLRRIVQIVADLAAKPLTELRLLDLGCFEGQYAIEFALQGAEVVGIEGREVNLAKARFTAEAHGLQNLTLLQGDARELDRERLGTFDAALCLGLLYHFDFPEVLRFLERLAAVCTGLVVIDTHICLGRGRRVADQGRTYRGMVYPEHSGLATASQREDSLWASLDNPRSFWPTRASLINALLDAGFTSVYECEVPPEPAKPADRRTFVAVKGQRVELRTAPGFSAREWQRVPERRRRALWRNHAPGANLLKRVVMDARALAGRRRG